MRALFAFGRSILPRSPARQLELEREILEELQFHLDCRAEANRECGLSADEARASALRQFGDTEMILDACIDAHDSHTGRRALRLAARTLPIGVSCGFAAAVLITLYALMIRLPASYPSEGHWVVVWWKHVETGLLRAASSIDDFEAWRDSARTAVYVSLAEYRPVVTRLNGTSERLTGKYVAGNYLRKHGIEPVIGRTFSGDAPDAAQRPVLISYQFWERRFGRSDSALGTKLDVDGVSHTIVGVAPEEYQTFFPFDFFAPLDFERQDRSRRRYLVSIRVMPGVTVEEAQREFAALDPVGAEKSGWHVHMRRPQEVYGGGYPRHLAPYAIVALMLLVAAVSRARSNPAQAGRSTFLLTTAAVGLIGIGTAFVAIEVLRNTVLTGVDQRFNFTPDGTAALAFLAVTLLAVASSGPRIRLKRPEGRRRPGAGGAIGVSPALAVTTTLAFLMLATAVTLTHDWWRSRSPNVGLDVEGVFTVPVLLPAAGLSDREAQREFFRATTSRID
ncbi:MAG TPA: ABC transporter permease, partial [Rhodothermia bacterium]